MIPAKNFNLWLFQIIGLLGLLALCLWLVLRTKDPIFTITDFSVPTSSNNSSPSPVNEWSGKSMFKLTLEIKNPNKESSIRYDVIFFNVSHGVDMVGNDDITPSGKDKSIQEVPEVVVSNPQAWLAFVKEISSNGKGELNVALLTRVTFNTWGIKSKKHGIKMKGVLPIGSDGKIKDKNHKVKLHRSKD